MIKYILVISFFIGILDILLTIEIYQKYDYEIIFWIYGALIISGGSACFFLRKNFFLNFKKMSASMESIKKIKEPNNRFLKAKNLSKQNEALFVYFYVISVFLLLVPGLLTSVFSLTLIFQLYMQMARLK